MATRRITPLLESPLYSSLARIIFIKLPYHDMAPSCSLDLSDDVYCPWRIHRRGYLWATSR